MSDEELKALADAFRQKLALDPEIRAAEKKIAEGKADFSDTSRMFWRRSELLGDYMQGIVPDLAPEDRERLAEALLRMGYNDTNGVLVPLQEALDEPLGVHLTPVVPKYPAERVATVAHALMDPTVPEEKIVRRAGAPVANVNMSFHDKYMEENARIRARLGMKPTITRYGSGCCKWCSEVAGRYRFGEQPKDIFRRHDNCGCTIIYDNQVLRGHRNEDGGRSRAWEEVDPERVMEDGFKPVVFSHKQAESLQNSALNGLTLAGKRDILREESKKPITQITDAAIDRVPKVSVAGKTDQQNAEIQNQHRNLLELSRRENSNNEVAFVFDSNIENRKEFFGKDDMLEFGQLYGHDLFIMHNHPRNSSYSATDIIFMIQHSEVQTLSIVKNNGSVEVLTKSASFDAEELKKDFGRILKKTVKTESVAEYDKAVKKLLEKHSGDGGMLEWIK